MSDDFGRDTVGGADASGSLLLEKQPEILEPGDHERFSHYVPKDKILESALTGQPVRALCGKLWVPNRDPEKFPVCPDCKKIYERMQSE